MGCGSLDTNFARNKDYQVSRVATFKGKLLAAAEDSAKKRGEIQVNVQKLLMEAYKLFCQP